MTTGMPETSAKCAGTRMTKKAESALAVVGRQYNAGPDPGRGPYLICKKL